MTKYTPKVRLSRNIPHTCARRNEASMAPQLVVGGKGGYQKSAGVLVSTPMSGPIMKMHNRIHRTSRKVIRFAEILIRGACELSKILPMRLIPLFVLGKPVR